MPPPYVEANHPGLTEMRHRLGQINAELARERLRQKGAEASEKLAQLKEESKLLQQQVWDFEAALRKSLSQAVDPVTTAPAKP